MPNPNYFIKINQEYTTGKISWENLKINQSISASKSVDNKTPQMVLWASLIERGWIKPLITVNKILILILAILCKQERFKNFLKRNKLKR